MIKIVIPTLGRINKQISYNNLPDKYKKNVYFVVREKEYKEIKHKYTIYADIIVLPKNIETGIAPTRVYILEYFKDDRIWMIDDDLTFYRKKPNNDENIKKKWISTKMTEKDFDILFLEITKYHNTGVVHGAINISSTPPSLRYWPRNKNGKIGGNVFLDIPNLPKDIEYFKYCPAAEDYDTNLQLLKKGYNNIIFTDFCAIEKTNAPGGCSTFRTLEIHNKSQLLLKERHPKYVKINTKKKKKNNEEKINLIIYWKKAYNDFIKSNITKINIEK